VSDADDDCPNTPAGFPVDQNGCSTGQLDPDHDGVSDPNDNCPNNFNPNQADLDKDGKGDACDNDIDGDNEPNSKEGNQGSDPRDACDPDPNDPLCDTDGDGTPNPDDPDDDNDGVPDGQDPDPLDPCVPSADACDTDGDGVNNAEDNCDNVPNPGQNDADGDGIGNACDPDTVRRVPTRVTIRWSDDNNTFWGWVEAEKGQCRRDRDVRLLKVRPGPDLRMGIFNTGDDNVWKAPGFPDPHGQFYARALPKSFSTADADYACEYDRSGNLRLPARG
jgi:hypothetical protein